MRDKPIKYLTQEFKKLYEEGFTSYEDYIEAVEELPTLSTSILLQMYKTWKDTSD